MTETQLDPEFDYEGFARRLREAMEPEKVTAYAARIGVPQGTLSKYLAGRGTAPRLDMVARIARETPCSLDWLAFGVGEQDETRGMLKVPRYDATLAAGAASWNAGRRKIEDVPFTQDFMRAQLGRSSATGLTLLEARGDSMAPTIQDRAAVMIDENDTRLIDDVFAFVLDGDARLKRFRRLTDGLMIISDNPSYPPEQVRTDALDRLQIIGRAVWVGQRL